MFRMRCIQILEEISLPLLRYDKFSLIVFGTNYPCVVEVFMTVNVFKRFLSNLAGIMLFFVFLCNVSKKWKLSISLRANHKL